MDRLRMRAMMPSDLNRVIKIISAFSRLDAKYAKRYYRRHFAEISASIPRLEAEVIVACLGNEVVGVSGFLQSDEWDDVYWLGWTYVDPPRRGTGIGRALFQKVQRVLRARGCRKLLVDTSSHKTYAPALNFYRKRGCRLVAVIPDYYGAGEDQLILAKDLAIPG